MGKVAPSAMHVVPPIRLVSPERTRLMHSRDHLDSPAMKINAGRSVNRNGFAESPPQHPSPVRPMRWGVRVPAAVSPVHSQEQGRRTPRTEDRLYFEENLQITVTEREPVLEVLRDHSPERSRSPARYSMPSPATFDAASESAHEPVAVHKPAPAVHINRAPVQTQRVPDKTSYRPAPEKSAPSGSNEPPTGDATSEQKMMARAQKKFNQLDLDENGALEGNELEALAEWVWSSFHPGGEPLDEKQTAIESAKLLRRLDANQDGSMTFPEFAHWFTSTSDKIQTYRRGLAVKTTKPKHEGKKWNRPPTKATSAIHSFISGFTGVKMEQKQTRPAEARATQAYLDALETGDEVLIRRAEKRLKETSQSEFDPEEYIDTLCASRLQPETKGYVHIQLSSPGKK